ncbi:MAG: hypothetical protein WCH10_00400 [bacterium]
MTQPAGVQSPPVEIENPRGMLSDKFNTKVKAQYKHYTFFSFLYSVAYQYFTGKEIVGTIKAHSHDTIIKSKDGKPEEMLGAALPPAYEKELFKGKDTLRITEQTQGEKQELGDMLDGTDDGGCVHMVIRMPMLDHGVIDEDTGKNIALEKLFGIMRNIKDAKEIIKKNAELKGGKSLVYSNCMAGRSRSQIAVISDHYINGCDFSGDNAVTANDLKNGMGRWGRFKLLLKGKKGTDALQEKAVQLNYRLNNHPLPSDIAAHTRAKRSAAKEVSEMDGDQAGFLGLMALHKEAEGLRPKEGTQVVMPDQETAKRVARDIGLALRSPIDAGFRDKKDREEQEESLETIYKEYEKFDPPINLLREMVVPIGKISKNNEPKKDKDKEFNEYFKKLPSSAQAHFVILANGLKEKGVSIDLPEDFSLEDHAKIAVKNSKNFFASKKEKLTAGDQVELLRTFGEGCGLKFEDVAEKIATGSRMDKHNAGIQLAELFGAVKGDNKIVEERKKELQSVVEKELKKLSHQEQYKFVVRLNELALPYPKDVKPSKRIGALDVVSFSNEVLMNCMDNSNKLSDSEKDGLRVFSATIPREIHFNVSEPVKKIIGITGITDQAKNGSQAKFSGVDYEKQKFSI